MATEEVRQALQALADANGGNLTPSAVVQAAKDPDSPLHSQFTWDDSKAGQQWRLEQARTLIRSVKVIIRIDTRRVSVPGYVHNPNLPPEEQGYVTIVKLRSDTDLARDALVEEFSRVASLLTRARHLAAALDMADEVDRLVADLGLLRQRAEQRQDAA